MNEMHNHNRIWREWYNTRHDADASKPKPSYEDWLEARIRLLEQRMSGARKELLGHIDEAKPESSLEWCLEQLDVSSPAPAPNEEGVKHEDQ